MLLDRIDDIPFSSRVYTSATTEMGDPMAGYKAVFFAGAIYQGQPVPILWAVDGPADAGTATLQVIIGGQTVWRAQAPLPMTSWQGDSITPQRADLAHALYDIPAGAAIPNPVALDAVITVNVGGTTEELLAVATAYVYRPIPFIRFRPITPGQPISAEWGLDTTGANPKVPNSSYALASVELSFGSGGAAKVLQPPTEPVYVTLGNSNDSVQDVFAIDDASVAAIIYKKGTKSVDAQIVLSTLNYEATFNTTANLAVELEQVDATWWEWTAPGGFRSDRSYPYAAVGWNTVYGIGGRVSNRSAYAVVSASVELKKTDLWDLTPVPTEPLTPVGSKTVGPLQPQESDSFGDVIIGGENQNFRWLDESNGGFLINTVSPLAVSYFAEITLTDAFANVYPATLSSEISVDVSVPDSKYAAAKAAEALIITLVLCTIGAAAATVAAAIAAAGGPVGAAVAIALAIVAAILAAAAAIATVEFAQQINNAKDPPSPSRRFFDQLRLPAPRFPKALSADTPFVGLRSLMLALHLVGRTNAARSEVISRLMGARIARDTAAMQLQHTYYTTLIGRLRRRVQLIPSFAAAASNELTQAIPADFRSEWAMRIAQSQNGGLAQDLVDALTSMGVAQKRIRQVGAVVSNATIADAARASTSAPAPGELDPTIKRISDAVTVLADSLLAEADAVLKEAIAASGPGTPRRFGARKK